MEGDALLMSVVVNVQVVRLGEGRREAEGADGGERPRGGQADEAAGGEEVHQLRPAIVVFQQKITIQINHIGLIP